MITSWFRDLSAPFGPGLLEKVRASLELPLNRHQAARLRESIAVDVRKACDMLVPSARWPEVSVAAAERAEAQGIDLRAQTWHTQPSFDPGRRVFHYEHMTPVAVIVKKIQAVTTPAEVVDVLADELRLAWITKEEDQQLTKLGYRHKRPDPAAAYAEAGIQLLPRLPDPEGPDTDHAAAASPGAQETGSGEEASADEDPSESTMPPAPQEMAPVWRYAISWFVASELVRRYPHYSIVPNYAPEGVSDRLWVGTPSPADPLDFEVAWSLNRAERGGFHVGPRMRTVPLSPWQEFFAHDTRWLVEELERWAGLDPKPQAVPATPRSLTYRVIARVLYLTATSRAPITCTNLVSDSYTGPVVERPGAFAEQLRGLPAPGEPGWVEAYRWWVLHSDGSPVALLHDDGHVWTMLDDHELLACYHQHDRRLEPLMHEVFGALLP